MMRQKIPHNNVCADKGNVNLENDILWVKPDVPFFFFLTREIINFLNTEVKVIC
jgi:hypothetical protein